MLNNIVSPSLPVKSSHLRIVGEEERPSYDGEPTQTPPGFGMIPAAVYDLHDAYALAVYAVLARHADGDGVCWPSIDTIADTLGVGRSTVERALRRLKSAGLVAVEARFAHGMKQANAYKILAIPDTSVGRNDTSDRRTGYVPQTYKQDSVEQYVNPPIVPPAAKTPTKRATPLPDDFAVTDEMRAKAVGYGVPVELIDFETEKFRNRHGAKGSTFKDWTKAWYGWMQNAVSFGIKRPTSNGALDPEAEQRRRNTEAANRELERLYGRR